MFKQIQIQTKTGCNLKCPMCPLSRLKQPSGLLAKEVFSKIINELVLLNYTGRVSLYLMNEPFLDERLSSFIIETRNKLPKARINISTNGVIPTPELIEKLINIRGLSDCDVSCYNQASYDKWKNKKVNAVNMIDYKYNYNNRGGNSTAGKNKKIGGYCERPFIQMYINAFGQAILCCSDYRFEVVMGDVTKNTLLEIWNNNKYKRYREALKAGNREDLILCKTCNYP